MDDLFHVSNFRINILKTIGPYWVSSMLKISRLFRNYLALFMQDPLPSPADRSLRDPADTDEVNYCAHSRRQQDLLEVTLDKCGQKMSTL